MRVLGPVVAVIMVAHELTPLSAHAAVIYRTVEWWLADCRANPRECLTYLDGLVQGLVLEDAVAHEFEQVTDGRSSLSPRITERCM